MTAWRRRSTSTDRDRPDGASATAHTPGSYAEYLRLDSVLSAQHPTTAPHDQFVHAGEQLFIVVHQAFELWFKQLVLDLDCATASLASGAGADIALSHLRRVAAVLDLLGEQMSLLDHLATEVFLAFRDNLGRTSGAESTQHQMIKERLGTGGTGTSPLLRAVLDRVAAVDLAPAAILNAPAGDRVLKGLLEALVDISEGWHRLWREHRRVVARFIGSRTGTGGTSGTRHLDSAREARAFPDLLRMMESRDRGEGLRGRQAVVAKDASDMTPVGAQGTLHDPAAALRPMRVRPGVAEAEPIVAR